MDSTSREVASADSDRAFIYIRVETFSFANKRHFCEVASTDREIQNFFFTRPGLSVDSTSREVASADSDQVFIA